MRAAWAFPRQCMCCSRSRAPSPTAARMRTALISSGEADLHQLFGSGRATEGKRGSRAVPQRADIRCKRGMGVEALKRGLRRTGPRSGHWVFFHSPAGSVLPTSSSSSDPPVGSLRWGRYAVTLPSTRDSSSILRPARDSSCGRAGGDRLDHVRKPSRCSWRSDLALRVRFTDPISRSTCARSGCGRFGVHGESAASLLDRRVFGDRWCRSDITSVSASGASS